MGNLTELMRAHDWYFEYSDDHRVWLRGSGERLSIIKGLRALDIKDAIPLIEMLAPAAFRTELISECVRALKPAEPEASVVTGNASQMASAANWLRNLTLYECDFPGCGRKSLSPRCPNHYKEDGHE